MAYNPYYYQQMQPMGQLEQLRAGQYQQMPQPMPPQQTGNGLLWVQGEAGAKSFMVAPGASVLLMDSERNSFYLKSADASGMPSMRYFDYSERSATQMPPAAPAGDYVTRAEFDALVAKLSGDPQPKRRNQTAKEVNADEPAV